MEWGNFGAEGFQLEKRRRRQQDVYKQEIRNNMHNPVVPASISADRHEKLSASAPLVSDPTDKHRMPPLTPQRGRSELEDIQTHVHDLEAAARAAQNRVVADALKDAERARRADARLLDAVRSGVESVVERISRLEDTVLGVQRRSDAFEESIRAVRTAQQVNELLPEKVRSAADEMKQGLKRTSDRVTSVERTSGETNGRVSEISLLVESSQTEIKRVGRQVEGIWEVVKKQLGGGTGQDGVVVDAGMMGKEHIESIENAVSRARAEIIQAETRMRHHLRDIERKATEEAKGHADNVKWEWQHALARVEKAVGQAVDAQKKLEHILRMEVRSRMAAEEHLRTALKVSSPKGVASSSVITQDQEQRQLQISVRLEALSTSLKALNDMTARWEHKNETRGRILEERVQRAVNASSIATERMESVQGVIKDVLDNEKSDTCRGIVLELVNRATIFAIERSVERVRCRPGSEAATVAVQQSLLERNNNMDTRLSSLENRFDNFEGSLNERMQSLMDTILSSLNEALEAHSQQILQRDDRMRKKLGEHLESLRVGSEEKIMGVMGKLEENLKTNDVNDKKVRISVVETQASLVELERSTKRAMSRLHDSVEESVDNIFGNYKDLKRDVDAQLRDIKYWLKRKMRKEEGHHRRKTVHGKDGAGEENKEKTVDDDEGTVEVKETEKDVDEEERDGHNGETNPDYEIRVEGEEPEMERSKNGEDEEGNVGDIGQEEYDDGYEKDGALDEDKVENYNEYSDDNGDELGEAEVEEGQRHSHSHSKNDSMPVPEVEVDYGDEASEQLNDEEVEEEGSEDEGEGVVFFAGGESNNSRKTLREQRENE